MQVIANIRHDKVYSHVIGLSVKAAKILANPTYSLLGNQRGELLKFLLYLIIYVEMIISEKNVSSDVSMKHDCSACVELANE